MQLFHSTSGSIKELTFLELAFTYLVTDVWLSQEIDTLRSDFSNMQYSEYHWQFSNCANLHTHTQFQQKKPTGHYVITTIFD